jgi:hypothetical protein
MPTVHLLYGRQCADTKPAAHLPKVAANRHTAISVGYRYEHEPASRDAPYENMTDGKEVG